MSIRSLFPALLLALTAFNPALAQPATAPAAAAPAEPVWPFEESDLPLDPAYRFGTLDNGMRYIIRPNGTPAGQGMVQLWIDAGSVSERDDERGYAHFIEHMAFNGSARVPEGEMVRLLEREGLAFGADTNAQTSFDTTIYKLDLPRNDPELLDTALMLMRETASELTFAPEAVKREKGVILSERRVRDTYSLRNTIDQLEFFYPEARFPDRLPIGTLESLQSADAERLKAMWQRLYRPDNTALIVVGEFDPDAVEAAIRSHFADWQAASPQPQPSPGPIDFARSGETDIYIDPALAERVTAARVGPWLEKKDSVATRQQNVLRRIGYGIINRRLQRLTRMEDPPFRGAGIGTADVFEVGRTTNLIVDAAEGEWRRGLAAAQREYHRALEFGFTEAEVAEQVATIRTLQENAAAGADTRPNSSYVGAALLVLQEGQVPTTPQSGLERFEAFAPEITPQAVLEALKDELVPLDDPLLRFEGRTPPEGGAEAIRAAWEAVVAEEVVQADEATLAEFAYTDFGEPGTVVSDTTEPLLGIRTIRFANGLMLNLKPTELQRDRITVELHIDGGQLLNTRENPLATAMAGVLPIGGLGQHSYDELQSILAGRSVGFSFAAENETFRMGGTTTPRDLELQLQLLAAAISDPGYRPQGEAQYRRNIENFFARRDATPNSALANSLGEIISDGDPRFTLQPKEDYLALDFTKLREAIGERLEEGALELALVGDFDPEQAIDFVSRTLGALPPREEQFGAYEENRRRGFTADRSQRVIGHSGPTDQAIVRMSWPTRDDSDFDEVLKLELLERIARLELTDSLREELGQTYSPGVSASQSRTYPGYGTFNIAAPVETAQIDAAREAMLETLRRLVSEPIPADTLLRARRPLIETYDSALKTNAGWMQLADDAQREPHRIARFASARERLEALTPEDIRAIAAHYLKPDERLEILVLPKDDG